MTARTIRIPLAYLLKCILYDDGGVYGGGGGSSSGSGAGVW